MSGIDKLQDRILQDAKDQAEKSIIDAKKQADDIISSAESDALKTKEAALEKAKLKSNDLKERLIAMAELESRKKKLAAKQEVIDKAFRDAMDKMLNLPVEEYKNILVDMIAASISNGDEQIILSKRDLERYGLSLADTVNLKLAEKGIKAGLTVSDQCGIFKGGFVLRRGKVELNNSFETAFKMMHSKLEEEVVKILFA